MSDTVKPIMSSPPPPTRAITTGAQDAAAKDAADKAAAKEAEDRQQISVRALGSFHAEGDMRGDLCKPGDTFTVDRLRASQLRANGLVEYVNEEDGKRIHGEVDAAAITERVAQRRAASEIPANSRTTPLRNPQLGIADLKA